MAAKYYKCCSNKELKTVTCVQCGEAYHVGCKERSYKKAKEIKLGLIECCEGENLPRSNDSEIPTLKIDARITLLERLIQAKENSLKDKEEIIDTKNQLINELNAKNLYLENKIKSLTSKCQTLPPECLFPPICESTQNRTGTKNKDENCATIPLNKHDAEINNAASVKTANTNLAKNNENNRQRIRSIEDKQIDVMNKIINLQNETKNSTRDDSNANDAKEWKVVRYKEKKETKTDNQKSNTFKNISIQGTNKDANIKGAPKWRSFHAYRLSVDTTVESLKKHLEDKNISAVKCEKLNSKHPDEYTSFKISAPSNQTELLLDPKIWPEGVLINHFLERLKRGKTNT